LKSYGISNALLMIVCEGPGKTIESSTMSDPSQAILDDRRVHRYSPTLAAPRPAAILARSSIDIAIYDGLDAIEQEWRSFETEADCTVFQSFDWLATWFQHIGQHAGVTPAIVAGRRAGGELLFLAPLAVVSGLVRRLTWLGGDFCDYNCALLAKDFSEQVTPAQFDELWAEICRRLQRQPQHRHDLVELKKMPETVGAQPNPFVRLDVGLNPSGAHLMPLNGTWDEIYNAKRSSATRRRDRTKRKRLGELGEVRFVTPQKPDEIARTLETLVVQKSKSFARMGVTNMFALPGRRDFFFALATNPRTRHLTHVSRLDVGSTWAAINLGLVFGDCYYHVLASYDDGEVSRFGPGAAHLRDLLCYAVERGLRCFDFTIGDERYKLEWSERTLLLYDLVVPVTARGWPLAALARGERRLTRAIKQNPALWTTFSRLRAALVPGPKKPASEE
jgi:CelD/BcsL family acetyltransferase involved in cellulose biosynthesis